MSCWHQTQVLLTAVCSQFDKLSPIDVQRHRILVFTHLTGKVKRLLRPVWKAWLCLGVRTSSLPHAPRTFGGPPGHKTGAAHYCYYLFLRCSYRCFPAVNEWPPRWVNSLCMYPYLMWMLHKVGQELINSQVIMAEKRSHRNSERAHGRSRGAFCFSLRPTVANTESVFSPALKSDNTCLKRCVGARWVAIKKKNEARRTDR